MNLTRRLLGLAFGLMLPGGVMAADDGALSTAEPSKYGSPIVISKGGIYSGNWKSDDDKVPAVMITTPELVTIEYSHLTGPGRLISGDVKTMNLTVRHSSFHGKPPNDADGERGYAIAALAYHHLVVENNYFENVGSAVRTNEYDGDGTPENTLIVRYNRCRNLDNRRPNGKRDFAIFVSVQNYRLEAGNPRSGELRGMKSSTNPGKVAATI